MAFKLKEGMICRARDGSKHGPLIPLRGHEAFKWQSTRGKSWTNDGRYWSDDGAKYCLDLIAEWKEPKAKLKAKAKPDVKKTILALPD